MSAPEGLRARRRRETARDVHAVALRLARERGFDAVTVEAISAEAGIAPRTFFNYFPSKEAAVVRGPFEVSESEFSAFCARPAVPHPELLSELVGLLASNLAKDPPGRDDLHDVLAVARVHPGVLATMLGQLEAFQRRVAALVAGRLNRPEDDEVVGMIAAVALAVLRTGVDRWAARTSADAENGPVADIERAVAQMRGLFDPTETGTSDGREPT